MALPKASYAIINNTYHADDTGAAEMQLQLMLPQINAPTQHNCKVALTVFCLGGKAADGSFISPKWSNVLNDPLCVNIVLHQLIFLRYWTYRYLEWQLDKLPQQSPKRAELEQWCQPVPESQWRWMSEPLKEANQRVRALYATGHQWESQEVQAVLREYDRVTL